MELVNPPKKELFANFHRQKPYTVKRMAKRIKYGVKRCVKRGNFEKK